ncbi:protein FAM200B-like [Hetaerina americana]|uniref:protein FAM200B-like n=1 Tax=Hetaerina americana TaxID=62018 RepID=UPI003A7F55A3
MYGYFYDLTIESCDCSKEIQAEMEKKAIKRAYSDKDLFSESSDGESDEEAAVARKKKQSVPIRKYSETFLAFAFSESEDYKTPRPLCLICGIILPNSFMKASKLRRHFMNKHADLSGKPLSYFEKRLEAHRLRQKSKSE